VGNIGRGPKSARPVATNIGYQQSGICRKANRKEEAKVIKEQNLGGWFNERGRGGEGALRRVSAVKKNQKRGQVKSKESGGVWQNAKDVGGDRNCTRRRWRGGDRKKKTNLGRSSTQKARTSPLASWDWGAQNMEVAGKKRGTVIRHRPTTAWEK